MDEAAVMLPGRATAGGEDLLPQPTRARTKNELIRPVLLLMLLVNLAGSFYQLPLNRVIERRLCREYYAQYDPGSIGPDGAVDEQLCKIDSVQRSLAWMQGVMETAWIFGDFVMTIPLGFLSEKYGRRLLLLLNLLPRVVMLAWTVVVGYFDWVLPTKAILIAPFLSVLGGDCFFNAVTFALAAGSTDDPVLRSTYFGYMSSVSYVVALIGPALASVTMSLMLWLPFFVGIFLLFLAAPVIGKLPGGHAADPAEQESQPLISSPQLKATRPNESLFGAVVERLQLLHSIVVAHSRNFSLLLVSFVLTSLASSDTKLLPQYISKRYHWLFSSTGYLLSIKAVVNFVLLALVIPWILGRRRTSPSSADELSHTKMNLYYANLCLTVSVLGALAIAVASSVWILVPALLLYALGSALPVFTLSLLKSPAISPPTESTGKETQTFSIVMLVKTSGSLLGAPLMATLWAKGISMGGAALGMPYFVSSACYAMAMLVLTSIQVA